MPNGPQKFEKVPAWASEIRIDSNDRIGIIINNNKNLLTRPSSQSLTVPSVRSMPKAQLPVEEQMASPDSRHRPIPRVDSGEEPESWKATQATGSSPAAAASGSAARAMLVIFMMDGWMEDVGVTTYYVAATS